MDAVLRGKVTSLKIYRVYMCVTTGRMWPKGLKMPRSGLYIYTYVIIQHFTPTNPTDYLNQQKLKAIEYKHTI